MRRKAKWTALAFLFGSLLVAYGCSDDDNGGNNNNNTLCGNGQIDQGEQCDGDNLNGQTCVDVSDEFAGGTLMCASDCTFDTSHCIQKALCGNGQIDQGEQCDCGTDPQNLPANCTDVNGGPHANCSSSCQTVAQCGNGIQETGEECDCGTDPDNLPTGCNDVNGAGNCSNDCKLVPSCSKEPLDYGCDFTRVGDCCPDDYGAEYECVSLQTDSICLEPCSSTQDCYMNMMCAPSGTLIQNHCYPALCSPDPNAIIPAELNGPCQVPGGREGYCFPVAWAEDNVGICIENGEKGPGEDCQDYPSGHIDLTGMERDATEVADLCADGLCGNDGKCLELCDWHDSYDATDTCRDGFNCLALTYFSADDPNVSYDDDRVGHRTSDIGFCIQQGPGQQDAYMCDLADPNMRLLKPTADATNCAGVDPDPTNDKPMGCVPYQAGQQQGEIVAAPVGVCAEVNAPTKAMYEECDAQNDTCPPNSMCFPEDVFVNLDNAAGTTRCLPFCNAETADASTCGEYGTPPAAGYACTSLSMFFAPKMDNQGNPIPGETADGAPSALGLCACPPSGCQ